MNQSEVTAGDLSLQEVWPCGRGEGKVLAQGVTWEPSFLHYDPSQPLIYTYAFMYTYMYIVSLSYFSPGLLSAGVVGSPRHGW